MYCPRSNGKQCTKMCWLSCLFFYIHCLSFLALLHAAAAAAKLLLLCLTLCNPIDISPPGSPTPGILQARILERVAISFSNTWKWKVKVKSLSCVQLFTTPWTAAHQAPPSMGFSRQEYWSGVPLPSRCLVKWNESGSIMFNSLWSHGLYSSWNSPGQNTGVGSLSLLQGIFPTQWSNPGHPLCRCILYHLSTREAQEYWSG